MNWKIILLIVIISIVVSFIPSIAGQDDAHIRVIFGLLTLIVGLIIRIVFLINLRIKERIEEDKLLASIRSKSDINKRVEELIIILNNCEDGNAVIAENVNFS